MTQQEGNAENFDPKASAEAIRKRSRKMILLPSAQVQIEIRKLNPANFLLAGLDIPLGSMDSGGDKKTSGQKVVREIRKRPDTYKAMVELIMMQGIVSPRVIADNVTPEDGEVNISDLSDDLTWIVDTIVEFSGLGGATKKFFPKDKRKKK